MTGYVARYLGPGGLVGAWEQLSFEALDDLRHASDWEVKSLEEVVTAFLDASEFEAPRSLVEAGLRACGAIRDGGRLG